MHYPTWPLDTLSLSDTGRSDFRGTFNGESITSPELIASALHLELHSYYSTLLELGLQKLLVLHPSAATFLIELVAGEDCVISAKLYYLTQDCTLIAKDVAIPRVTNMPTPTLLHWRLRINHGN